MKTIKNERNKIIIRVLLLISVISFTSCDTESDPSPVNVVFTGEFKFQKVKVIDLKDNTVEISTKCNGITLNDLVDEFNYVFSSNKKVKYVRVCDNKSSDDLDYITNTLSNGDIEFIVGHGDMKYHIKSIVNGEITAKLISLNNYVISNYYDVTYTFNN
ncbi:MAG TPA: hypothetical protein PKC24_00695 [Cyclobacteriaceae bacterium]|nr:hypothetical protein [Cyclobacteriaceae bacterium]